MLKRLILGKPGNGLGSYGFNGLGSDLGSNGLVEMVFILNRVGLGRVESYKGLDWGGLVAVHIT